jgi:hypothetical protein
MADPVFRVEIHGATGAGKTILLASLYKHLREKNGPQSELLHVTKGIDDQLTLLQSGTWTGRTEGAEKDKESIVYKRHVDAKRWVEIHCTAHRGEDLGRAAASGNRATEGAADQPSGSAHLLFKDFATQFTGGNTLFVAVANPFLLDCDLSYRAVLGMAAILQKPETSDGPPRMSLKSALHKSLDLVLGMNVATVFANEAKSKTTQTEKAAYPALILSNIEKALSVFGDRALLVYDHDAEDPSNRFKIRNLPADLPAGTATKEFTAGMKELIQRETDRAEQKHAVLRTVLGALPDSVLALTHVDLDAMIRSVDARDYRNVFRATFRRNPGRRALQEHLSCSVRINTRFEPAEVLTDSAEELCEYIDEMAARANRMRKRSERVWSWFIEN